MCVLPHTQSHRGLGKRGSCPRSSHAVAHPWNMQAPVDIPIMPVWLQQSFGEVCQVHRTAPVGHYANAGLPVCGGASLTQKSHRPPQLHPSLHSGEIPWLKNKPAEHERPAGCKTPIKNQDYAPSSPMASTGQPSFASLHCLSSSGFSGCFDT